MQVAFDSVFVQQEEEIEAKSMAKYNKSAGLKRAILEVKTRHASDFENLTLLYRQIFQYLLILSDADSSGNRAIEREIAAALEVKYSSIVLSVKISQISIQILHLDIAKLY